MYGRVGSSASCAQPVKHIGPISLPHWTDRLPHANERIVRSNPQCCYLSSLETREKYLIRREAMLIKHGAGGYVLLRPFIRGYL